MNIFVLDEDPVRAASFLCDKHMKMALETAQILCTVSWQHGAPAPYRPTHKNHPCVIWAGEARGNWTWLQAHGVAISQEYTKRYGKRHASQKVIEGVTLPPLPFGMTDFVQAMPDEYKGPCPVEAYRRYYLGAKKDIASWKLGGPPAWWA